MNETRKAGKLTPDDLGRVVTIRDAVFGGGQNPFNGAARAEHKLKAVTEVLTFVAADIDVEPGKLFRRVRTVRVALGSMRFVVDANSLVELEPTPAES